MSYQFDAIFADVVIRPLEPLNLPDRTRIKVTVDSASGDLPPSLDQQQAALEAMFAEIDALPHYSNNDAWSARDHDEVLYGRQR